MMDHKSTGEQDQGKDQKAQIEFLCLQIKDFAPSDVSGSWTPETGGEMIAALNKLSEALQKKAAEIKQYVRSLTVEELNELDGFDRGPHLGDEQPQIGH